MEKRSKKGYIVGIDTGGTFTDTVVIDEDGAIAIGKHLTDYQDFKGGVINSLKTSVASMGKGLEEVLEKAVFVGHGTTLGTNAVIDRSGYIFCGADDNYKEYTPKAEVPGSEMGEYFVQDSDFTLYHEYYCPGCLTLLDVENQPPGAPPIWDIQLKIM